MIIAVNSPGLLQRITAVSGRGEECLLTSTSSIEQRKVNRWPEFIPVGIYVGQYFGFSQHRVVVYIRGRERRNEAN